MEQIRQLLAQLSLHLELNIAMCDMIEKMEKRLDALEPSHKSLKDKVNSLSTQLSQFGYYLADESYKARHDGKKAVK